MSIIYLAEITAYDPDTSAEVTWRFASGPGYDNAGTFYAPRLENPGNVSRAFAGGIGGRASASLGEITLVNNDGGLNPLADDYFDGRRLTLKQGDSAAAYATFTTILSATIESAAFERERVSLRLRDRSVELDKPFSAVKYAGDNALPAGTEGTADDLKDKYKPRLLGRVALMTPVCVNTSRLIYQVNDGAVDSIANVYDAGAYLSRGADYTSAADMQTNAPGGGQYRCLESAGMFRLGSQPYGQISACVIDTWPYLSNSAAGLIQAILTEKGYTASDWIAADFTALNQKNAGSLGLVVEDGETTASLLNRICESVGAWWGFNALGTFRVARFEAPSASDTAVYTFTEADWTEIDRAPEDQLPLWSVKLKADINYAVQDRKSLAGVVPEDRAVWFAQDAREQKIEDAAVKTSRKLADEAGYDSLLNGISIASAEAQRRLNLYKVRRDVVRLTAADPSRFTTIDLGSVVTVQTSRFGYTAGKKFIVTSLVVNYERNQIDFVLWG